MISVLGKFKVSTIFGSDKPSERDKLNEINSLGFPFLILLKFRK